MSDSTEPKLLSNLERYRAVLKAMLDARKLPSYTEAIEDAFVNELDFLWYKKLTPEDRKVLHDEAKSRRHARREGRD